MQLCDWAYLNLLDSMSQACLGKTDEATLFMLDRQEDHLPPLGPYR